MRLNTGDIVNNRYRIVKQLGEGGFGAVYKAWDLNLNTPCALKENLETSQQAVRQFTLEATLLATLRHPNLPRVTDHFTLPGQGQYLVMDYIEGEDLQELFEHNGRLTEKQVLPWMIDVCDALVYLHAQSSPVIHRDIKPANIKVTPQGRAVLVDFGIAKVYDPHRKTTQGAQAVTPPYSPFEQYGKGRTDARTDIYALGMTMCVLLTAYEPPESIARLAGDPMDNPRQHNPAISPEVESVILKAIAVMPDQRYQTASDLKQDLQALRLGAIPTVLNAASAPLSAAAIPAGASPVSAVIVSSGGGGQFRTISEALRSAPDCARVQVAPGRYEESLVIERAVELVAMGDRAATIITSSKGAVITGLSSQAVVRGFTLSARALLVSNQSHAVDVSRGELTLEDCDISSDTLAVVCISGRNARANLSRCLIHGSRESGILCENGARARIDGCDIYENQYPGITISGGAAPELVNCRIHDNATGGIHILGKSGGVFEDCEIFNNNFPEVTVKEESQPSFIRCRVHSARQNGFHFLSGARGRLEECEIYDCRFSAVAIKEKSSPSLLRCRIHNAQHEGVYILEQAGGLLEDCEIFENHAEGVTIIDSSPTLRGCTISRNGQSGIQVSELSQAVIQRCEVAGNRYSGITVSVNANPMIEDCQIHDNQMSGLHFLLNAAGSVYRSAIYRNLFPDVSIEKGADPLLSECTIREGKQNGLHVLENGKGKLEKCTIQGSLFPGVAVKSGGAPRLTGCKISQNAQHGVYISKAGGGHFINCSISGNFGSGALIANANDPVFQRSELMQNQEYGIMLTNRSRVRLDGCRLTGNARGAKFIEPDCTLEGNGNIE